ncbi:uncharacterized protein LOC132705401 isoform X3 [Cylas formicarius]|uniref:uncharacterized protein LOC132705401 isoform X3 n=1 Tax=Cylas formicarius TaxID=197179 RepID=UPI0029586760|nr:uncharacterized protein LOC132705401 isoform X3 [Cylas formicarius]
MQSCLGNLAISANFLELNAEIIYIFEEASHIEKHILKGTHKREIQNIRFCYVATRCILFMEKLTDAFNQFNRNVKYFGNSNLLDRFLCKYSVLSDIVRRFTASFGIILLTIVLIISTGVTVIAIELIKVEYHRMDELKMVDFITAWLQIVLLANAGERLSNEGKRTVAICYDLLFRKPKRVFIALQLDDPRQQLLLLAQQAAFRRPEISAAGFFPINHSLLIVVISTVCSYFIVAMQIL